MIDDGSPTGNLSSPADLFADCWAISYAAERELGPAAQTLGAFERLCAKSGQTFASIAKIAEWACLPTRTCERHVVKLIATGWIECIGRRNRRTNTYKITDKFREHARGKQRRLYPRFSGPEWTWSMRAVFAVVANAQLAEFVGVSEMSGDEYDGMTEPVSRSISAIAATTGLTRPSVRSALNRLESCGYLHVEENEYSHKGFWLYVRDVPIPQIGCKKVADLDCQKVADQTGEVGKKWRTGWKKVADWVEKSGGLGGKKWRSQLRTTSKTTLNTTPEGHPQAFANASPEGCSGFFRPGEDGREENPAFDPYWLSQQWDLAVRDKIHPETDFGRKMFCCAAAASRQTGQPLGDIQRDLACMDKSSRHEWGETLHDAAADIHKEIKETFQGEKKCIDESPSPQDA